MENVGVQKKIDFAKQYENLTQYTRKRLKGTNEAYNLMRFLYQNPVISDFI